LPHIEEGLQLNLYTYYRSSSAYRVRIALALKGQTCTALPVNLLAGDQLQPGYRALNPQGRVPLLELAPGVRLSQSSAIIEYLDERYPQPPLLPAEPLQRARVREVAALIGCDIHPLHNVAVLDRLRQSGLDETQVGEWIRHWISEGLGVVEGLLAQQGFCFGDEPGLADVYLIPELYAAERFKVSLQAWPRLARVAALAAGHPAFVAAHPANQADTPR
jgi:maleylacetoacetate isomerase